MKRTVSRYGSVVTIPMKDIVESPYQVRVDYGDIDALATDIQDKGLIQPILVRPNNGGYEIVHGHRRHKAVESLGALYIDAFTKELTDSQAITIQGSENIHRKDYTAIEEGRLYHNYQRFLENEEHKKVSTYEVAKQFRTSQSNVEIKMSLLWLPKDVQDKIHNGIIPSSKARKLTILTRELADDDNHRGEFIDAQKTNHFYAEIRKLAEQIEKGPLGGLRTTNAVAKAAQAIRMGADFDEAVTHAKEHEAVEIARNQMKKGASPKEILDELEKTQLEPSKLQDSILEANLGLVRIWLRDGLLKCPYCGENHLVWRCNGKEVLADD